MVPKLVIIFCRSQNDAYKGKYHDTMLFATGPAWQERQPASLHGAFPGISSLEHSRKH